MLKKACKMALVCAMVMMMVLGSAIAAKGETYALTTVVVSLDYDADVVHGLQWQCVGVRWL